MSFFDTEEAHAVMLAYAADRGGRAALKVASLFFKSIALSREQAPAWIIGKEQAQSTCQVRCKKRYPYSSIAASQAA